MICTSRGEYDIVAIGEVDSFDDIAAVKLLVASSGAVENLTILEMIDMNSIANKAAAIAGAYRPGRIARPELTQVLFLISVVV